MKNDPPFESREGQFTAARRNPLYLFLALVFLVIVGVTFGVAMLLITIFEHKQEAQVPYVRLVEVDEVTTDPVPWGINWSYQFDTYKRTVERDDEDFGGSSALTASKLEKQPWLKRLYAGYAFSIDYRELRGHAYMLYDQEVTERVTKRTQSGSCLHCHASIIPTYRRLGMLAQGKEPNTASLAEEFDWPAVMEGFRVASGMTYFEAHEELLKTPDGTPDDGSRLFPGGRIAGEPYASGEAHPVSCVDCHDPKTMRLRVTRPGFVTGIAALAKSEAEVPHLPSIEQWRKGKREKDYDPNEMATRLEMRSFACAQCHVEYYCATKETLFFPWDNGLRVEQIEETYDNHKFPDGTDFYDYKHGETGAEVYKAQHPEFELWSQGIHARSGVSCTDCHMPYERKGATKVTSHWVRSSMKNVNNACQTCHNVPEDELRNRVLSIQTRTVNLTERAARAMTDMLDAIREAQAAGASEAELGEVLELQKKAMWRLDYISSENSKGFHADQESARILGESIDYSRMAEAMALRLRAPEAPESTRPVEPVKGITGEE